MPPGAGGGAAAPFRLGRRSGDLAGRAPPRPQPGGGVANCGAASQSERVLSLARASPPPSESAPCVRFRRSPSARGGGRNVHRGVRQRDDARALRGQRDRGAYAQKAQPDARRAEGRRCGRASPSAGCHIFAAARFTRTSEESLWSEEESPDSAAMDCVAGAESLLPVGEFSVLEQSRSHSAGWKARTLALALSSGGGPPVARELLPARRPTDGRLHPLPSLAELFIPGRRILYGRGLRCVAWDQLRLFEGAAPRPPPSASTRPRRPPLPALTRPGARRAAGEAGARGVGEGRPLRRVGVRPGEQLAAGVPRQNTGAAR